MRILGVRRREGARIQQGHWDIPSHPRKLPSSVVSLRQLIQRHHEELQGEGEVRRARDREGGGRALQVRSKKPAFACNAASGRLFHLPPARLLV